MADIIPFPKWVEGKKSIDSESDMVAWMIDNQSDRLAPKEAAAFGRSVWRESQRHRHEAEVFVKRGELDEAIHRATRGWVFGNDSNARMQIHNHLRVRYSVNSTNEIPAGDLQEAIEVVRGMDSSVLEFLTAMNQLTSAFSKQVFGNGEPWTPWVRRTLKRDLGERPNWRELAAEIERRTTT